MEVRSQEPFVPPEPFFEAQVIPTESSRPPSHEIRLSQSDLL